MVNFIIFSLFCYGFSNIVIYGSIFSGFRNLMIRIFGDSNSSLGKLVTCFICLPTWVGFIVSIVNRVFFPLMLISPSMLVMGKALTLTQFLLCVFFDGIVASGVTWLIHTLQEYFERSNQTND